MRLTNTLRQAFVSAAMQDVPTIDYSEQIRVLLQKAAQDVLPEVVRKAWENKAVRPYFRKGTYNGRFGGKNISVAMPSMSEYSYDGPALPPKALKEAEALGLAWAAQESKHLALKTNLEAVAASVTTRKALVEALPEFEKYLPAEEAKASNLPAVANLLSDFVKAGWPKQNAKAVQTMQTMKAAA